MSRLAQQKKMMADTDLSQDPKGRADLVKVYEDLENLLKALRQKGDSLTDEVRQLNIKDLRVQLARTKTILERKIGNTVLLETQNLKRKLRNISTHLRKDV